MISLIQELSALLHDDLPDRLTRADDSLPPNRSDSSGFSLSHVSRLAVPLEGCHTMEIAREGRIVTIGQIRGGATFMPLGAWNRVDWFVPVRVVTFMFGPEETGANYVTCPGDGRVKNHLEQFLFPPLDREGRTLLEMMSAKGTDGNSREKNLLLVKLLLYHIMDQPPLVSRGKGERTYRNICSWLRENRASRPTREEVAALFKITPNYLSNLFKERSGRSYSSFVNRLKTEEAKRLLSEENLTLAEIAYRCGFGDAAYFCRVFKKETGLRPLEFSRIDTNRPK